MTDMDSNKSMQTMKKTACLLMLAPALFGCSRIEKFTSIPFVYFQNPSMSVYEDAGTVEIPVSAMAEGDFTVSFEMIDGTRKDAATGQIIPNGTNGEDYSLLDNDAAVLHFSPGDDTQFIRVNIVDFPGILTGNKEFTIKLLSAGSHVSLGGFSTCKVTIIDNDHPLKSILGEYTATDAEGNSWTMTFADDPDNNYNIFLDGIVPAFAGDWTAKRERHYVVAKAAENLSTVTVNLGEKLADPYDGNDITIFGYDGTYIYGSGTARFTSTDDGYELTGNMGFAAIYEFGGSYYLAASNALAMAPITLVKKQ